MRKASEEEMNQTYNYYSKLKEHIPYYITRNLKEMPNNKGYIWKGVFLYGEQPREDVNNIILFEQVDRNVLVIHEWTSREYKQYEKIGKERRQLIYKKNRN